MKVSMERYFQYSMLTWLALGTSCDDCGRHSVTPIVLELNPNCAALLQVNSKQRGKYTENRQVDSNGTPLLQFDAMQRRKHTEDHEADSNGLLQVNSNQSGKHTENREVDSNGNGAPLLQFNSVQPGKHKDNPEVHSNGGGKHQESHRDVHDGQHVNEQGGSGWSLKDLLPDLHLNGVHISEWFQHHRLKFLGVFAITIVGGLAILGAMLVRRKNEDWTSGADSDADSQPQTPRAPADTDAPGASHESQSRKPKRFKVFGREVAADGDDADYVFILPLKTHSIVHGTEVHVTGAAMQVMQWGEIVDGIHLADGIFEASYKEVTPGELSQSFQHEMNREAFISTSRKLIMDLLVGPHFGLEVKATASVDRDELLLRLALPKHNSTIQQYAENVGYKMPLSNAAYERIGSEISHDEIGTEMRAVAEFSSKHAEYFEPFSRIDRLVLLRARLDKFLDLDGLVRQGVIAGHFPLHKYTDVMAMREGWANPWQWFQLPTEKSHHSVRNYFGEEVTWMFVWQSHFTRALLLPAALGAGVYYCRFFLSENTQNKVQIGYAIFMGLWCAWFNAWYDRKESRLRHSWGMNDFTPLTSVLDRYDYKPELDGTWQVKFAPVVGDLLGLLFVCLTVSGMHYIEYFRQFMVDRGFHWMFISSAALLISFQILVLDMCWRRVSMFVVGLENHRSETDWLESWVQKMFPVRLFNNLYPFLYIGFMKQYTREGCPKIEGGCLHELETDLTTYFFLRVFAEFGLDLMYVTLVRAQMLAEMEKKESQGHVYTYIEVQSKAMDYDKVRLMDDWTEQVLTFAFVACFNVILPAISFIALVANLLETRLVAYRNACFLRRPMPVGANGIGAWRQMLLLIEIIAVIVNFGFAVFVMSPLKVWEPITKCVCFLVGEHVALVVKFALKSKFPAVPQDIANIGRQQQQDVKRTFVDLGHHRVEADVVVEQAPDVGPRALGACDLAVPSSVATPE